MRTQKENSGMLARFVRPIGFGTVAGAVGTVLVLLLLAAVLTAQDVPQNAVTPLALVAAAVGAFIGGFVAARIAGQNGWLTGLLTGLLLFLLLLISGGCAMLDDAVGSGMWLKLAVMAACAAVGGMVAVNLKRRR